MDFNSLGNGNPFYILRQGEKPVLEVGVVKSKDNDVGNALEEGINEELNHKN